MSGIGGIRPDERDVSRRRDRQAAWVLVVAALVSMFILYPLAIVLGLVAAAYAWRSGEQGATYAALAVVCLTLLLLLFGVGDGFDGGAA